MEAEKGLKAIFKPPLKKDVFSQDLKQVNIKYKFLRNQILVMTMVTYIMYYFTRKSIDLSGTALMHSGGLSTYAYSVLGMVFAIVYGTSKFIIGNFADRSSGRIIMILGLIVSAILNILLGGVIQVAGGQISIAPLVMMIIFIAMLGLFQGMGWPAVARMFAHWYTDKERSVKIGIWSGAQGIGSALVGVIVVGLLGILNPTGSIFGMYYWIPSIFALLVVPFAMWGLRDRPESEGLPTIEKWKGLVENEKEKKDLNWKEIFVKYILKNKYVWVLAFANIWVYVIRNGISTWSLKIAEDYHNLKLKDSVWLWTTFEWGGVMGGILAAFSAKWWFQNRKAPVMIIGLIIAAIGIIGFQLAPRGNEAVLMVALLIAGFGIYMPQTLIGATAIELTNKKAAATASGFTGLLGYFGDAVMARPVVAGIAGNSHNWNNAFIYFYVCIAIAIVAIAFLWTKNQKDKIL